MKLTPEFIAKVQSSKNGVNSFEKCQHSSWLKSDPKALSVIDTRRCYNSLKYGRVFFEKFEATTSDSLNECNIDRVEVRRCYNSLEYGRIFFEKFKATTSDSLNGCNIDRVEVHPCYIKTDPLNIFWGFNDTEFDYECFGITRPSDEDLPVTKYSMFDENNMKLYLNQIVSSTAFFFQCPKCEFLRRSKSDIPAFSTYYVTETSPSIPRDARNCDYEVDVSCDLKAPDFDDFFAFNLRVLKYSMFDENNMKLYLNRIVSSTAFFFRCPKCEFLSRSKSDIPAFSTYYVTETSPSIPRDARNCDYEVDVSCDLSKNAFANSFKTSFSQKVLPFTIVNDKTFDC
uniref:Uncharacterized protein n=1 Tax=Panagrolaimus sp. PS1159 TaxID=55785 RepID=A0AC35G5X2_9BILA